MGTAFLYGNGGGSNLNFKVVGGTAEPGSPKENTIWVVTDAAISKWHFRAEANPSWAEPEGTVFITSSTDTANIYINAIKNANKGNMILLHLLGCIQYSSGAWRRREAYIYQNGAWRQFSRVFSATINITYPAGSTCTATDGTTTLTAPNTSGVWTCVVPNAGNWTVTATNGTQTKSSTVSITTYGQSASVSLGYTEYVIQNGVIDMTAHPATVTENSGDNAHAANGLIHAGKPSLCMYGRNGIYCTHSFANVTVPAWATVFKIEVYYIPAYEGDPSISIIGASATISRGSDDRIQNKTVSIDVSSISGQTGNLRIRFQGSAYNDYCCVGNAWFE